jgi:hypothetical protein
MPKYAEGTKVSAAKSESDIKRALEKFGATKRLVFEEDTQFVIMFEYEDRRVRFTQAYPDPGAREFTHTPTGMERSENEKHHRWQQECRRIWRSLVLIIKAKLLYVSEGTRLFEEEFLSEIVLPNNQTVGEYVRPQIAKSISTGKMPPLLPGIGETGG